jgi:uncharacterized protein (UPF0261 family)
MKPRIGVIGAFDTKGVEYAFLRDALIAEGASVFTVNTGILGTTDLFPVDCETAEVVNAAGADLALLRHNHDRGEAMKAVARGAAALMPKLVRTYDLDGVIGMGGTGGTSVVTAAMQALPIGFPKLCVSTAASGNVAQYVGTKDIMMMPSVVDVAGINRISRLVLTRAAGAIVGMASAKIPAATSDRPLIAASMFGNTTDCVNACAKALTAAGYEVLIFHATGSGGRTMESLVDAGLVEAVLDLTTTEWADTIAGGVFDAGEDRLSAPGRRGVPHLISNGCIDMVNFGPPSTVPQRYAGRKFHEWNPSVTLMRTNREENQRMGRVFAEKANAAQGPVAFLLPLKGVSILDGDGQPFCDRAATAAFTAELKLHLNPSIPLVEVEANINDPEFSTRAVEMLLELVARGNSQRSSSMQ